MEKKVETRARMLAETLAAEYHGGSPEAAAVELAAGEVRS